MRVRNDRVIYQGLDVQLKQPVTRNILPQSFLSQVSTQKGYADFRKEGVTKGEIVKTLGELNNSTERDNIIQGLMAQIDKFETTFNATEIEDLKKVLPPKPASLSGGGDEPVTPPPVTIITPSTPKVPLHEVPELSMASSEPVSSVKEKLPHDHIAEIADDFKVSKLLVIKVEANLLAKKPLDDGIKSPIALTNLEGISRKIKSFQSKVDNANALLQDKSPGEMGLERHQYELVSAVGGDVCHHFALGVGAPTSIQELFKYAGDKKIAVCFFNGEVAHTAVFDKKAPNPKMPWIQSVLDNSSGSGPIFRTSIDTLKGSYKVIIFAKNKDPNMMQAEWKECLKE